MSNKVILLRDKVRQLKARTGMPHDTSRLYVDEKGNLSNGKPLDWRAEVDEKEDKVIKGYLLVWGVMDSYRTIWLKGCCAKSIADRGPDSTAKQKIIFLWQHDQRDPIGQFRVLKEDDYGLYFEAVVDDVTNGIRALKQVRSGTLNGFSVGFNYVWDKIEYDDTLDALVIREVELHEGSVVTIPSQSETFAFRSAEQYENAQADLCDDIDYYLRSLPRDKRAEGRELFTRHAALLRSEPPKQQAPAPTEEQPPAETGIDYGHLLTNFKL